MITKTDCMSILVKLEDQGIDINAQMKKLALSKDIPIEVLRFISNHRGIEVANFYEVLRKSYNNKKSHLYKNLVSGDIGTDELPVVLSSLLTQIMLYAKKISDKESFYAAVRATEITKVIDNYVITGDSTLALKLLALIKSDILVLEYYAGRREVE